VGPRVAVSSGLTLGAALAEANPKEGIVEMSYSKIVRSGWKDIFDVFTKAIEKRLLEIVSRDIDDHRCGSWLNLNGTTYDARRRALRLVLERHTTSYRSRCPVASGNPCEINEAGLVELMVSDLEGHQQFMWLREPLAIPVATMEEHSS
jgi:hypothetical protein